MRRLIVLDVILVVLIALGGMRVRQDWRTFVATHDVAAIQPGAMTFPSLPNQANAQNAPNSDWTEIPTKDPFSFDRNDVDIVPVVQVSRPAGPKPVLFGTMIIGNDKTAFISPPGNRTSRPMKVGETIEGWKVIEIAVKTVEVESDSERQTLVINDPVANVGRDYGKNPVPTGGGVTFTTPPATTTPTNIQSTPPGTTTTPPPPPTGPQGQRQGHWEQTPFGMKWYDDPPKKP